MKTRADERASLAEATLEDMLPLTWGLLEAGAASAADPFHTPALATSGFDGPALRTVVLRFVDPAQRIIACHTDRRSAKAAEVLAAPRAAWLFYDAARKLQLRLSGGVTVHLDDDLASQRWAAVSNRSRACYNTGSGPGRPADAPPAAPPAPRGPDEEAAARGHFAVLACRVEAVEWLFLSGRGHRRARIELDSEAPTARWLTP